MWKTRAASRHRRRGALFLALCCLGLAAGCRRDMQDQPRYNPYRPSSFFKDGAIERPLVEGTVPRGYLRADKELFTGKRNAAAGPAAAAATPAGATGGNTTPAAGNPVAASGRPGAVNPTFPDDVDAFPFPITKDVLARGQDRYNIFCIVCHGALGYGDGMVVRRGYKKAANYHTEALRKAPVGHFFDVVTNGWGAMPSYAQQIPVQDRWAIIAYIRALQASQAGVRDETAEQGQSGATGTTSGAERPGERR